MRSPGGAGAQANRRTSAGMVLVLRDLTFEVRRDRQQGVLAARRMIDKCGARPARLAVGPRLDRGVRRHFGAFLVARAHYPTRFQVSVRVTGSPVIDVVRRLMTK